MKSKIYVHLPLPYFNSDQLIRTVSANADFYRNAGIHCPDPTLYRSQIQHVWSSVKSVRAGNIRLARNYLAGFDDKHIGKTLISLPMFTSRNELLFDQTGILPTLGKAIELILAIYKDYKVYFLLGIVNPGLLVASSAMLRDGSQRFSVREVLEATLFWYDALGACADSFPDARFVLWVHEKTYSTWPRILNFICERSSFALLPGSLDMAAFNLSKEGLHLLADHVRRIPPQNEYQFSKVASSYFCKYQSITMRARKIRLKGWDQKISLAFEKNYDFDLKLLKNDSLFVFADAEDASISHSQFRGAV
jgi:hypothetical protein